jgi:hypothetical protein
MNLAFPEDSPQQYLALSKAYTGLLRRLNHQFAIPFYFGVRSYTPVIKIRLLQCERLLGCVCVTRSPAKNSCSMQIAAAETSSTKGNGED